MKKYIALTAFVITGLISCTNNQTMTIEPIDKELNNQLLTGERLDPNLFSRTDLLQYFQVSNSEGVANADVLEKLKTFVDKNYNLKDFTKVRTLKILFYKKELLSDVDSRNLYESARDNETGMINGQNDNILSFIIFRQVPGSNKKLVREITLYDKDVVLLDTTDTVDITD